MCVIVRPYEKKLSVKFFSDKPSMTKQSFRDECDINNILKKYRRTGVIEHQNRFNGDYGDFCNALDYRTGLDAIREAEALFDGLPARVRERFKNDPAQFLGFVENPQNRQEMIDLGLIRKPVVSEPVKPAQNNEVSQ